ncbi:MAG TPA: hypothetical protein DCE71_01450 [Parachlamydiales bacterium]|nr:hypothetical protein [Parachlamydiales bacterium]
MSVYYGKSPAWPNTSQMRSATIASIFSSDEKATRVLLECLSHQCHLSRKLSACWDFIVHLQADFPSMSPAMLALSQKYQEDVGKRYREESHRSHMSLIGITYRYNSFGNS